MTKKWYGDKYSGHIPPIKKGRGERRSYPMAMPVGQGPPHVVMGANLPEVQNAVLGPAGLPIVDLRVIPATLWGVLRCIQTVDRSWSYIWSGTSDVDAVVNPQGPTIIVESGSTSNTWRRLHRIVLFFNVPQEPGKKIVAGTLLLRGDGTTFANWWNSTVVVQATETSSNTTLVASDYQLVATSGVDIGWQTVAWRHWSSVNGGVNLLGASISCVDALNTHANSGLLLKLAIRAKEDVDNAPPTWSASKQARLAIAAPLGTDTSAGFTPPQLLLVYA